MEQPKTIHNDNVAWAGPSHEQAEECALGIYGARIAAMAVARLVKSPRNPPERVSRQAKL